jgi:hypothetical protein
MEGGSGKEEQPTGIKRGEKQKLTAVDTDQEYLDALKKSIKEWRRQEMIPTECFY